ncbi:hypothetical protein NDU88_003614 [Pleurodeles waltl]|uniref:Uncharacterized protein n=1 Tax=Pleurodeles waltl TaxID=8319 RepID=A0AAV7WU43_PLEWA|nr:hypothetical protein NDU88_003614 [Pleurodeles waltl]
MLGTSVLSSPTGAHSSRRPAGLSAPQTSLPSRGAPRLSLGPASTRAAPPWAATPDAAGPLTLRALVLLQPPATPRPRSGTGQRAPRQGSLHDPEPPLPRFRASQIQSGPGRNQSGRPQQVSGVPGYPGPRPRLFATGFRGRSSDGPLTPVPSGGKGLFSGSLRSTCRLAPPPRRVALRERSPRPLCGLGPKQHRDRLPAQYSFGSSATGPQQEEGLLG